jgi:cysteinyl-tRNA synthetase
MKIHNTLSNKIEDFKPIENNKVKIYACGPTVYNYIHIGNARMAVVFDVLRNLFEYKGFNTTYIQNYTDIDDKIIKQAEIMNISEEEVAKIFIEAYEEDMKGLLVKKPNLNPKVTEHINDIVEFIRILIEKGYAYQANGDVYFKINKYKEYGQLSNQSTDNLNHGVRIKVNEHKEDEIDFTLWKNTNGNGITWDSPWGKGRPGWHIECSVMAHKHLGQTIDIHGGGIDLCFPHHENEMAQSSAYTDKPLANYWMHNGHVTIDGRKMSKSLGNVVLVKDALNNFSGEVIRFFFLNTYYRNPIDYTEEVLIQSKNSLEKLKNTIQNLNFALEFTIDGDIKEEIDRNIKSLQKKFIDEMSNDLNTSEAITALFAISKNSNEWLSNNNLNKSEIELILKTFNDFGNILGFNLLVKKEIIESDIQEIIEKRNKARKDKDFKLSDQIRNELKDKGIILEDTPNGTKWNKV